MIRPIRMVGPHGPAHATAARIVSRFAKAAICPRQMISGAIFTMMTSTSTAMRRPTGHGVRRCLAGVSFALRPWSFVFRPSSAVIYPARLPPAQRQPVAGAPDLVIVLDSIAKRLHAEPERLPVRRNGRLGLRHRCGRVEESDCQVRHEAKRVGLHIGRKLLTQCRPDTGEHTAIIGTKPEHSLWASKTPSSARVIQNG